MNFLYLKIFLLCSHSFVSVDLMLLGFPVINEVCERIVRKLRKRKVQWIISQKQCHYWNVEEVCGEKTNQWMNHFNRNPKSEVWNIKCIYRIIETGFSESLAKIYICCLLSLLHIVLSLLSFVKAREGEEEEGWLATFLYLYALGYKAKATY